jgi:CRISPR type IV-associated protein Csf2
MSAYIITASGVLTAATPVAVSPPDHVEEVRNKRTHLLPHITEYREGAARKVPIIPASTFRGVLRHAVTGLAFTEQVSRGGGAFTVNDYVNTAQGGVVQRKEEGEDKPLDFSGAEAVRGKNPIMGLFGNFSDKMPSRLLMRHASLEDPEAIFTVAAQVRTDPVERDADLRKMFTREDLDAFSTQMETRRQLVRIEERAERIQSRLDRISQGKEELGAEKVAELKQELKALTEKQGELSKTAGGSVNLQQITPRAQAIAQNATLRHGFTLNGVTVTEAALAVLAYATWVSAGARLGAMRRSGYGQLDGFYDLDARPASGVARLAPPVRIGRMEWSAAEGVLRVQSEAGGLLVEIEAELARILKDGVERWSLRAQ